MKLKCKGTFLFFALTLFFSVFFVSCKKDKSIHFDESEPLALAYDVSWALVVDSYAMFRAECAWDAEAAGYCRRGTVLKVVGKFLSPDGNWYKFDGGWLPETAIEVYANKLKAQNAASLLK